MMRHLLSSRLVIVISGPACIALVSSWIDLNVKKSAKNYCFVNKKATDETERRAAAVKIAGTGASSWAPLHCSCLNDTKE